VTSNGWGLALGGTGPPVLVDPIRLDRLGAIGDNDGGSPHPPDASFATARESSDHDRVARSVLIDPFDGGTDIVRPATIRRGRPTRTARTLPVSTSVHTS
jgi:hypothetical protein